MQKPNPIRLLIASNESAIRDRLATLAKRLPLTDVTVVKARNAKEAVESCIKHRPDLAFMDLSMPARDALAAIDAICLKSPTTRLVLLNSSRKDTHITKGLRAGAKGFIWTDVTLHELADCIRSVYGGKNYAPSNQAPFGPPRKMELTKREIEVLRLVAADMRNKEIGAALFITEGTVKVHIHNILSKLGVNSRTGAITKGLKRQFL
jgi:two-component system, NarL family, response regulator